MPAPGTRVAAVAALVVAVMLAGHGGAFAGGTNGLGASSAAAERALREHTLHTLDGRTMTLGSLAGSVVVVNFWASWCTPCRRELPRLGSLKAELEAAGGRVIAVSIDEDADNARRFCRAHHVTLQVAHDGPDGLAQALDLKRVPFTLVLDRAGRIAYSTSGSDDRALAELGAATRRLLAETPPAAAAGAGDTR